METSPAARTTVRVAIVGAGWAGLACGVAAASAGAQVDVYEQRDSARAAVLPDGIQGVEVVPNMMRDLDRLGLAEPCVRRGFPYRAVALQGATGAERTEFVFKRLAGAHLPAACGLAQQVLADLLVESARARGVRIHWGQPVDAIEFDGDAALLHRAGHAPLRPDLAVLATGAEAGAGAGSLFAAAPDPVASAAPEITWWCTLLRRPAGLDQPTWVLGGPRGKVLLVPVSGPLAGMALMGTQPRSWPGHRMAAEPARLWMESHHGRLAELAGLLGEATVLVADRARAALRAGPWWRGNLLCVGNAAHVLPPHLGQAAAQSFEDAVVFGELLARAGDLRDVPQALSERRQPRVAGIFDIAARAAQWDQAPDGNSDWAELAAAMAAAVAPPA